MPETIMQKFDKKRAVADKILKKLGLQGEFLPHMGQPLVAIAYIDITASLAFDMQRERVSVSLIHSRALRALYEIKKDVENDIERIESAKGM